MGAAKKNFHTDLMGRMGFEAEAKKIQELFLSGKKKLRQSWLFPDQFADEISLVGPKDRIKERVDAWRDTPVTSLLISTHDKEKVERGSRDSALDSRVRSGKAPKSCIQPIAAC